MPGSLTLGDLEKSLVDVAMAEVGLQCAGYLPLALGKGEAARARSMCG